MADQFVFCEGSMQKKEAKGKWVTYYCVLRGDRLWCFSNRDTNNPSSLVGSIKMTSSTQLKKHKTKDGNYQFKIRNDRGEYRFRCSFTSDRDRWLVEIGKCARGDIPPSAIQAARQSSAPSPESQMSMPMQMQMGGGGGGGGGQMMPQSQMRPQMEVPGMSGPGGGGENLLPGQRIALEENRRRHTSILGSSPSTAPPSAALAALPPQLVRGQGSSASLRSLARPNAVDRRSTGASLEDEYFSQEWFYGRIPRDVAEDYILSYGVAGSFLLRESESSPGCYSLSFKSEHNDVRHYKIVRQGPRYTLTGLEEKSFPNVIEVVQYYVEVNEGWATPLKRSITGYRKHANLRDDAQLDHSYTSGFDLPVTSSGGGGSIGPPAGWDPRSVPGHPGNHFTAGPAPAAVAAPMAPHQWSPIPAQASSKYIPPPPPMDPPPFDEVEYSEPPPPPMDDLSFCGSFNDFPPPLSPSGSYPPPPPVGPPSF